MSLYNFFHGAKKRLYLGSYLAVMQTVQLVERYFPEIKVDSYWQVNQFWLNIVGCPDAWTLQISGNVTKKSLDKLFQAMRTFNVMSQGDWYVFG